MARSHKINIDVSSNYLQLAITGMCASFGIEAEMDKATLKVLL